MMGVAVEVREVSRTFRKGGAGIEVLRGANLTLAAGDRYFAVAAGDPASAGAASFRLFAIDTTDMSWPTAALLPRQ